MGEKLSSLYDAGIIPIDPTDSIITTTQSEGIWSQLQDVSKHGYDPFRMLSISADEKEYLETIALAADLLASEVISPQDFFKLKLLLKSKDEEVRNAGVIFLNQKAKL
jgi:hypothetical protein